MSINVSKRKTILSKNIFASFATSILMITNIYLIIFVQRSTTTKIKLYTTLRRLFDNKLVTKFIIIFFITSLQQVRIEAYYTTYDEKL